MSSILACCDEAVCGAHPWEAGIPGTPYELGNRIVDVPSVGLGPAPVAGVTGNSGNAFLISAVRGG